MTPDGYTAHPLPSKGYLTIGRSTEANVRIADPRVSRSHAVLHVEPVLAIEDLGSGNGTRVRGNRIKPNERVQVGVGEAIVIGGACLMVDEQQAPDALTGVWSHSTFEARASDACGQARALGTSFGIGRIRVERAALWADIVPTLVSALRGHLLCAYGANDYHVLLGDAEHESKLVQLLADLHARLRAQGYACTIGTAWFPRDGRTVDTLIEHAYLASLGGVPHSTSNEFPPTNSPKMQQIHEVARRAAVGNINVLILGETGVGKEVMAQAIHKLSRRSAGRVLCLNCAGLGELLESELFGHERGAFTGAVQAKPGLLETADGGSVFLDEVGELSHGIQAKLLRVIDRREVTRLGGLKPRTIDVRFIAATNRDLEDDARRGTFRPDLLFRLNGISLELPPLRERTEDIADLSRTFLEEATTESGRDTSLHLSAEALAILRQYDWPGNIRELRNIIARAAILCSGDVILPEHLPVMKMRQRSATMGHSAVVLSPIARAPAGQLSDSEPDVPPSDERAQIVAALASCAGNQSRAARLMGMPRRTFVSKLKSYGIPRPQKQ